MISAGSMILIDEYARATSHLNGMALVFTLLDTFASEKIGVGLISTNLRELITDGYLVDMPSL